MNNHDITLTRINLQLGMSEETYCFKANLLIDGKKVAIVSNSGKGEATRFAWDKPEYREKFEQDESQIEDVILKHLSQSAIEKDKANAVRRIKRYFQSGLYFAKVGVDDKWYGYLKLKTEEDFKAAREKLSKVSGVDKILNDIPVEEALPYFIKFE